MRRRLGSLLAGGVAVGLTGLALASPEDRPCINWAKDWNTAVAEAQARNVPIFVTFHKDG